jgi:selenide,water dikinase
MARQRDAAVAVMAALNDTAMRAMVAVGVHAATDVTGFGLLGHLGEMLGGSVGAEIDADAVPLLEGVRDLAAGGVVPGGTRRNLEHAAGFTDFGDLDDAGRLVLADAQTSGGLLIAVPEARTEALLAALAAEGTPAAAVIGRMTGDQPGRITLR